MGGAVGWHGDGRCCEGGGGGVGAATFRLGVGWFNLI